MGSFKERPGGEKNADALGKIGVKITLNRNRGGRGVTIAPSPAVPTPRAEKGGDRGNRGAKGHYPRGAAVPRGHRIREKKNKTEGGKKTSGPGISNVPFNDEGQKNAGEWEGGEGGLGGEMGHPDPPIGGVNQLPNVKAGVENSPVRQGDNA